MTREEGIAWAAGLFEGEGCITTNRETGINLEMVNTDLDVLQKFLDVVKMGKIYGPTRQKHFKDYYKDSYRWRCSCKTDILEFWRLFEPHLCLRRRTRFAELQDRLSFNGNVTRKKRGPYKKKEVKPVYDTIIME